MSFLVHAIVAAQYDRFKQVMKAEYGVKILITPWPPEIKAFLDRIEKNLDLLKQSWSQMAGRNLVADIVREVRGLEALPVKSSSLAAAKVFREGISDGYGAVKARYHSALCLGYKVKTVKDGGFSGNVTDWKDMESKIEKLIKAIKAAYGSVKAEHQKEPTMLKIFMAPEFYFRGANGGYDSAVVFGDKDNKGLIETLRLELDDPIYKDWLFVLGTVIVVSRTVTMACAECKSDLEPVNSSAADGKLQCMANSKHRLEEVPLSAAVDNVALILKEKFVHSVSKELVSHIDYNRTGAKMAKNEVWVGNKAVPVREHRIDDNVYKAAEEQKPGTGFTDERMGGAVFNIDGISFGCEICLDHAASASKADAGRLENASTLQVQLLPSGGMSLKKFNTVANGVVFNVDGAGPHVVAAGLTSAGAFQALGSFEGHPALTTQNVPSWKELETCVLKLNGYFKDTTSPAPAAGPDGPVLQYGPFEIPV